MESSGWCAGAVLDVAGCAVCALAAPSSWRIGGCVGCGGGHLTVFAVHTLPASGRPQPASLRFRVHEAQVPCSSTHCPGRPPRTLPHSVGRACAGRVPCWLQARLWDTNVECYPPRHRHRCIIRKEEWGHWDPTVCVPKVAREGFPNGKCHFFPQWSLWSGGGVAPLPPPTVYSHSNTSLTPPPCLVHLPPLWYSSPPHPRVRLPLCLRTTGRAATKSQCPPTAEPPPSSKYLCVNGYSNTLRCDESCVLGLGTA